MPVSNLSSSPGVSSSAAAVPPTSLDIPGSVLVMGAGGSIGRHVLTGLLAAGVSVRASARAPRPGQFPDGVPVVTADLTDPASLARAFTGIAQVVLYATSDRAHEVVAAARDAGIARVVLVSSGSVIHPTSRGNVITEEHRHVEDVFTTAASPQTVPVRPLVLASNALAWAHSITTSGAVELYQPDALTAPIHEADVADVALAALAGADGVSDLLTGPARLSQREQVEAIAAATGQPVDVQTMARDVTLARLSRFMSPGHAQAVVDFLDDAAAGNSPATDTFTAITGRPGRSFSQWATDHAGAFTRPERTGVRSPLDPR